MEHGASTGMISTWTLELILLKARYHATEKVELDSSIRRNHIGETYMDNTHWQVRGSLGYSGPS